MESGYNIQLIKKILFRVDAQTKIGHGHFFRCLALANMLKSDFEVTFAMSELEVGLKKVLKKNKFNFIQLKTIDYSSLSNFKTDEVDFDLGDLISEYDIVVLDGYWFGFKYQSEIRKFKVKIIIIDDHSGGYFKADLLINTSESIDEFDYFTDNPQCIKLLGSKYAILRTLFLSEAKSTQHILKEDNFNSAFICFGGSDILNKTKKVAVWFLNNTNLKLHIVIGNSYPFQNSLIQIKENFQDRVILLQGLNEKEMVNEMTKASIGVVPASGILLECIACRLPVISGISADNQINIYNGAIKRKVIIPANNFNDEDLQAAWVKINAENLFDLVKNQTNFIDGYSDQRIKKIVADLC